MLTRTVSAHAEREGHPFEGVQVRQKTADKAKWRYDGAAQRCLLVVVLLSFGTLGCAGAQVFRLNPGESPERYRVSCKDSSRNCRRAAKETCEGEYDVLQNESNREEQKEVETSGVSSTGPSAPVGWRGELIIQCGRLLPPLKLVRKESPQSQTTAQPGAQNPAAAGHEATARPPVSELKSERVCIPGVTQACLGPGACSGAQACLRDGAGFGVCDCGESKAPALPSVSALPESEALDAGAGDVEPERTP